MTYTLRPYTDDDEDAAIALWHRTWQLAYPDIDFDARLAWWRTRWRTALVPIAAIVVAQNRDGIIAGFVTIDQTSGYLDQLVVSPDEWGSPLGGLLMNEAKRLSPAGVTLKVNADNDRAIAFYRKHGFVRTGGETNESGRAVDCMAWRPG